LTDALESTFEDLKRSLQSADRLAATHADPFFTFVHPPGETLELHRRLRRWRPVLERLGCKVETHSLRELLWDVVDKSGRWDDWLEAEEPGHYLTINKSMRDVLVPKDKEAAAAVHAGLLGRVAGLLADVSPDRLVLLTDAGFLHPWFRADKLGSSLHDQIRCNTVLFYPGGRRGVYGLRFLDFYPEDGGSYRTTIVGAV